VEKRKDVVAFELPHFSKLVGFNFEWPSMIEGMPASLGPGLRTASGANRTRGAIDRHRVLITAMTPKLPRELKIQLAFAIAEGKSAAKWARENHVPRTTAYRWAADLRVRRMVQSCRRRSFQSTLGRVTRRATRACDEMAKLASVAGSESVRLTALRAIVRDLVAMSRVGNLKRRIAKAEAVIFDRANEADVPTAPTEKRHGPNAFPS
jgi:hypothetical protein